MFSKIEQVLQEAFAAMPPSELSVSAANVAMAWCLRAPLFGNTYVGYQLMEAGPGLIQLFHSRNTEKPVLVDPLLPCYDDGFQEERGFCMPSTYKEGPRALDDLPAGVESLASELVQEVQDRIPDAKSWFHPTQEDHKQRNTLQIRLATQDEMNELFQEVLGVNYDRRLRRYEIDYHQPPSWTRSAEWRYLIAHNRNEVGGVVGWMEDATSMGLSYVSVAPGFRKRGLARDLYAKLIEHAVGTGRILIRSKPGDFASRHPGITACFDRMVLDAPLLHVTSGGYLHKTLLDLAEQTPVSALVSKCKPACDRLLTICRNAATDHQIADEEHRIAQELQQTQKRPARRP